MTQEQFDIVTSLFRANYNIADSLGSEASDVSQIILTKNRTLASCKNMFPDNFTAETITEDDFNKASRDADSLNALLDILKDCEKTFGLFRENSASWWLCVFWNATDKIGSNVLFRAPRAET